MGRPPLLFSAAIRCGLEADASGVAFYHPLPLRRRLIRLCKTPRGVQHVFVSAGGRKHLGCAAGTTGAWRR